ncbi:hypothetical protein ACFTS5_27750 [Nocardia sp. NPDC056952]|uniref:TRAFAC clade GTPase domain-containing protein n=1 Tax=Nocardia sp. NPDC056952 TaxID=3345979 RepID=UPI00363D724B
MDETLAAFSHGKRESLGPVFSADGRRSLAECPTCALESTHRLCPHCHSQLPEAYLAADSRIVAMVGAKGAGKSTYIAVLVHELKNRIGGEFDLSLTNCDDVTAERYENDFRRALYSDNQLLPATRSATTTMNRPLIYKLTRGKGNPTRGKHPAMTLVLFDNAGEDFATESQVGRTLADYLAAADAMIYLVDPDAASTSAETDVIRRVTDHLRARAGAKAGARLAIPMAVALTKVDSLRAQLPGNSVLMRPRPASSGRHNRADRIAVHEEIRSLLEQRGADGLDRFLEHNYRRYNLFGLSALGNVPDDATVHAAGIQPHRAEDPMLWLLHEFGMVASIKG